MVVINLTKTQGAGSLAHEWFHALDNYFSRMRGERHEHGYVTDNPYPVLMMVSKSEPTRKLTRERLEELRRLNPDLERFRPENWEPDPNHPVGVRVEMERAFAGLVRALNDSPMAERAQLADKGKKPYWSQTIERAARSFENYVIHKLDEQGRYNDYLANVVPPEVFARAADRYPYLKPDELAPVAEAFDNLFATVETRETDKGVALFSLNSAATEREVRDWNKMRAIVKRAIGRSAGLRGKQLDDLQRAGKWSNLDADLHAKLLQAWRANPDAGREFDIPAAQVPNRTQPDAECVRILQSDPVALLDARLDAPTGTVKEIIAYVRENFARHAFEAEREDIHAVELDERAAKASIGHGYGAFKRTAFAAITEVVKHGALITHARHNNANSYYIAAPVRITNEEGIPVDCIVTVLVHHDDNVQRVYLHRVDTKESLLQRGTSGTVEDAISDSVSRQSRSSAARGKDSVANAIHQGKVSTDEVKARLRGLLTLDVQQTQSAADDGIRYSLNALHEPTGASMNTDNTERTIALPSAADELLPELSRDVIAAQPFERV